MEEGRVKYDFANTLCFFLFLVLRSKKISPRSNFSNPKYTKFVSTRGGTLKRCFKASLMSKKDSIENEGGEKKKIEKPFFYGEHRRKSGDLEIRGRGKKKENWNFPLCIISIYRYNSERGRESRNVVANSSFVYSLPSRRRWRQRRKIFTAPNRSRFHPRSRTSWNSMPKPRFERNPMICCNGLALIFAPSPIPRSLLSK